MKHCPICGEQLEDNAPSCPFCGAVTGEGTEAPSEVGVNADPAAHSDEAEPVNEPVSQEEAPEKEAKESEAPSVDDLKTPEKKKKRIPKWLLITLIAAGVLIAACAVVYFTGLYISLLPASADKLALCEKKTAEEIVDSIFEARDKYMIDGISSHVDLSFNIEADPSVSVSPETGMILSLVNSLTGSVDVNTFGSEKSFRAGLDLVATRLVDVGFTGGKLDLTLPILKNDLYRIDVLSMLEGMGVDIGSAGSITDLIRSFDKNSTKKDVVEMIDIFDGLYTDANLSVEKNVSLSLFNGESGKKCELYTVAPSAAEMKAVFGALINHLSSNSYIGEKLTAYFSESGSSMRLDWNSARESCGELADKLAEKGFRLQLAVSGNRVVSVRAILDGCTVTLDRVKQGGLSTVSVLVSTEGSPDSFCIIRHDKNGCSKDNISGRVEFGGLQFPENVLLSGYVNPELQNVNLIEFSFDMNSRSALGTFAGSVSVSADGREYVSVVIEPGSEMKHTVKLTGVINAEALPFVSSISVIGSVRSGGEFSGPEGSPVVEIGTLSELIAFGLQLRGDIENAINSFGF